MNDDSGTTVEQTAPKRGPGRPPKATKTESYIALQEKGQRSNFEPGTGGRSPKTVEPQTDGILANPEYHSESATPSGTVGAQVLKISDMPKAEPQCQADRENHKLIGKFRESLEPFAKLPIEPDAPLEKVLYKISRGSIEVDITNGDIIRAKTVLGMM